MILYSKVGHLPLDGLNKFSLPEVLAFKLQSQKVSMQVFQFLPVLRNINQTLPLLL